MLTIGRALMTNPDLLILDEATEGLAPQIAKEIWRIIGEIRAHGIATLIVDKNYAAVTAIANRNVILVKGRVVFDGDSADAAVGQPDLLHKHSASSDAVRRRLPAAASSSSGSRLRRAGRPTLVFLHEGLGSLAMWRDFPGRVAHATGCNALVYSRYGYGNSEPLHEDRDACATCTTKRCVALPELLDKLGDRAADPRRPQRRRLDRADPCRRARAAGRRGSSRWRRT